MNYVIPVTYVLTLAFLFWLARPIKRSPCHDAPVYTQGYNDDPYCSDCHQRINRVDVETIMQKFLMWGVIVGIFLVAIAISLAISYLGYWLVLKAGAPNYVAVIVGIAIFLTCGWGANRNNK